MIRALRVLTAVWPLLTIVAVAVAQQPVAAPDPNTQALGQMIIEAAQREASLRAQLIVAQSHVATPEAAAKPATPPERPATIVPVPNAASPPPELPKP